MLYQPEHLKSGETLKDAYPVDEIFSFIGNSEKKCIIELFVDAGKDIDARELNQKFADCQYPPDTVRYASLNNLAQTINNSHRSIGAFNASDEIRFSEWIAHKNNESELFEAVAGHSLSLSADYGVSLEELFGKTSTTSGKERSPQTRLKIFTQLSDLEQEQKLSTVDLAKKINIKPNMVHAHVQKLYTHGFLRYEADNITDQQPEFEIIGDPNPENSTLTRRGERVRQMLHYGGDLAIRTELGNILMDLHKDSNIFSYEDVVSRFKDKENLNPGSLYAVMGVLLREGTVKRLHKTTTSGDIFSNVYLDNLQKDLIDRIAKIYNGLKEHDPIIIEEGIRLGASILADKALTRELLERDYNHSSALKRRGFEQRAEEIQALLKNGELTTREIQIIYDDGKLTLQAIGSIMRRMRKGEIVISSKNRNEQYWSLAK